MAIDVTAMLRKALADLEAEQQRIAHRIAAVRQALDSTGAPAHRRKPMSAAARRALSRRMKAYWAKRKGKGKKAEAKHA